MLLRKTGRPLMNGDFASFAACFKLPQTITTPLGIRKLTTTEELRHHFDEVRDFYQSQKVKAITRNCVKADFAGEATVLLVHETFLMKPVGLLRAPYQVFSILERHAEGWHITFSDYAVGDSIDQCRALGAAGVTVGTQPVVGCGKCSQNNL